MLPTDCYQAHKHKHAFHHQSSGHGDHFTNIEELFNPILHFKINFDPYIPENCQHHDADAVAGVSLK